MFRTRYILGAVISFVMFAMIVGCTQGTTDEAEKSTPQDVAVVTEETDVNEVTEALIAKFNNVKGDVQIVREDETITVEEAMEVPLQLGDRIVTGDDAGVNIYFNDETSVYVQDNGEMEFLYWERDTEKDSVILRHIAGVLLHVVRTGDQYIVLWDNDFIQAKGTVFITSIMNSNHSLHQLTGQSQYFAYNGPPSSDFYMKVILVMS